MNDNCVLFDHVMKKHGYLFDIRQYLFFLQGLMDNLARLEFLNYAMSLKTSNNDEHADSLPSLDISSMRHIAYVFDALVYYMNSGIDTDADVFR